MKLAKEDEQALLSFEKSGVGRKWCQDWSSLRTSKSYRSRCKAAVSWTWSTLAAAAETQNDRGAAAAHVGPLGREQTITSACNSRSIPREWKWGWSRRIGWTPTEDNPDQSPEEARNPEEIFTVLVSARSSLKFMNGHVVSITTIACTWGTLSRMAGPVHIRSVQVYANTIV